MPLIPNATKSQTQRRIFAQILGLLSVLCSVPSAHALKVSVSMEVSPTKVEVGEQFLLTIEAEGRGGRIGDVSLPDLSAFTILQHQKSSPFSFQFSMGRGSQQTVSSSQVHRFLLSASRPGSYRIQAARVKAGRKTYKSNTLTLQVTGTANSQPGSLQADDAVDPDNPDAGAAAPTVNQDAADAYRLDNQAFVRTLVSNASPYVGEQVIITHYLCMRTGLGNAPRVTTEPVHSNFWVYDLIQNSRNIKNETQVLQGVTVDAYALRKFIAFPLQDGTLTIQPMTVTLSSGSSFFGTSRRVTRSGQPLKIKVQALPKQSKATAEIAVGQFEMTWKADPAKISTGEASSIELNVRGAGRLDDIKPELEPLAGLRILKPHTEDRSIVKDGVFSTVRNISWLVIPEQPGNYTLPSPKLMAFNPVSKSYTALQAPDLTISATGKASTAPTTQQASKPQDPKATDSARSKQKPLAVVHRSLLKRRSATPLSKHPGYLWLLGALSLACLLSLFWRKPTASSRSPDLKKSLGNHSADIKKIKITATDFHQQLSQLTSEAISTALGISIESMPRNTLAEQLGKQGLEEGDVKKTITLLDTCDTMRFAPQAQSNTDAQSLKKHALELLSRLSKLNR